MARDLLCVRIVTWHEVYIFVYSWILHRYIKDYTRIYIDIQSDWKNRYKIYSCTLKCAHVDVQL